MTRKPRRVFAGRHYTTISETLIISTPAGDVKIETGRQDGAGRAVVTVSIAAAESVVMPEGAPVNMLVALKPEETEDSYWRQRDGELDAADVAAKERAELAERYPDPAVRAYAAGANVAELPEWARDPDPETAASLAELHRRAGQPPRLTESEYDGDPVMDSELYSDAGDMPEIPTRRCGYYDPDDPDPSPCERIIHADMRHCTICTGYARRRAASVLADAAESRAVFGQPFAGKPGE
jgi:hypothetical protein